MNNLSTGEISIQGVMEQFGLGRNLVRERCIQVVSSLIGTDVTVVAMDPDVFGAFVQRDSIRFTHSDIRENWIQENVLSGDYSIALISKSRTIAHLSFCMLSNGAVLITQIQGIPRERQQKGGHVPKDFRQNLLGEALKFFADQGITEAYIVGPELIGDVKKQSWPKLNEKMRQLAEHFNFEKMKSSNPVEVVYYGKNKSTI